MAAETESRQFAITAPLLIAVAAAMAAGLAWIYLAFGPKPAPPPKPVLTAEAKQYLLNLPLSDVGMQAAQSYIKQNYVEIAGKITNSGPKIVHLVEVTCVFRNAYGQEIRRERAIVVGSKTGDLALNQTKSFHLAFDNIPDAWNQAMPDLVIVQIQFA